MCHDNHLKLSEHAVFNLLRLHDHVKACGAQGGYEISESALYCVWSNDRHVWCAESWNCRWDRLFVDSKQYNFIHIKETRGIFDHVTCRRLLHCRGWYPRGGGGIFVCKGWTRCYGECPQDYVFRKGHAGSFKEGWFISKFGRVGHLWMIRCLWKVINPIYILCTNIGIPQVMMPHDGQPVQIRIGIHTGPCVSRSFKFEYYLFPLPAFDSVYFWV